MLQSSWSTNHYLNASMSEVKLPASVAPSPGDTSSKTHAFFAATFDTPLPPPTLAKSQSSPKAEGARTRSLNLDFFAVTPPYLRPTPPPSIRTSPMSRKSPSLSSDSSESASSGSPRTPTSPSRQLLSRLFPSRYSSNDEHSLPSNRCKFLELDNTTDEPPADEYLLTAADTPKPPLSAPGAIVTSASPVDTPRPNHSTPRWPATLTNEWSTSPIEDVAGVISTNKLATSASLSISMDMLPTPSGSRNGSIYDSSGSPPTSIFRPSDHLAQESHVESITVSLAPGAVICSSKVEGDPISLSLVRALGQGSFSSVWLGRDDSGTFEKLAVSRTASIKRQQINGQGIVRRKSSKRLRPKMEGTKPWKDAETKVKRGIEQNLLGNADMEPEPTYETAPDGGRLVAVKFTERALCNANDRTRVSFIREVEVLRHISHPSIVSYIHSFTTPTHHCLVLEHIDGEELFDLVNSDEKYALMDEPLLRRIWGELCKAVGWLHEVALVHRDIKLENILLTRDLRLPQSPTPLIKLTDFGLSRFIDPQNPLLTTRCGSESYAAPEIIIGKQYDGRETDAWACGVVLYALATRKLPFESSGPGSSYPGRKAMLMRIAKCEYDWPKDESAGFAKSEELRRVAGKLLVRDPRKRSKIKHLWDDEWMLGEGAPVPPPPSTPPFPPLGDPEEEDIFDDGLEDIIDDGLIVDGDQISTIASQELQ